MADLLAASIQVSGLSEEELERRLGWSSGSVGRILEGEGEEELDPEDLLRALEKLNGDSGLDRDSGFADMEDGQTQVVTDLLERFNRLGYELQVALPEKDRMDLSELEKQVESILRKAFGPRLDED